MHKLERYNNLTCRYRDLNIHVNIRNNYFKFNLELMQNQIHKNYLRLSINYYLLKVRTFP